MLNPRDTFYSGLRTALNKPADWIPTWATVLHMTTTETGTAYATHPAYLNSGDIAEIQALQETGWNVTITSPRLNRLRIHMQATDAQDLA